jgi:hypothetical protein
LSFRDQNDPDQPNNENKKKKLFSDAEQITVDALGAFKMQVNDTRQWKFIMSTKYPLLDIEDKIGSMFENYDFTTLNILEYWALHLPFNIPLINLEYKRYRWDIENIKQTSISIINGSKREEGCI